MSYDIVGSLPLELLVQVVEYLDLEDIVRSQRVSKQWHTIFSCETIIAPVLRETLAFLGLDLVGISTDEAIAGAMSYFRWRHGLQHARPVKKISLPWPDIAPKLDVPDMIVYHSRRLCYVRPHSNEVEVLDLETGKLSILSGGVAGRETSSKRRLSMSDRYLVLASREVWEGLNYLTAWDMHTKQKFSQRIPISGALYTIVEDKVVIAPKPEPYGSPIYVWDLGTNCVQGIGKFNNLILWHVDGPTNVLVAFEVNWLRRPPEVWQTKWTITTGQRLERKLVFHLPFGARPSDRSWVRSGTDLSRPYRTYGHKTVIQLYFETSEKHTTVHLEYDHAADLLNTRVIHSVPLVHKEISYTCSAYLTPNVVYRFSSKKPQVAVYNATAGTAILHKILPLRGDPTNIDTSDLPYYHVFGDREVLGFSNANGAQLWFFNPKFAPDSILKRHYGRGG